MMMIMMRCLSTYSFHLIVLSDSILQNGILHDGCSSKLTEHLLRSKSKAEEMIVTRAATKTTRRLKRKENVALIVTTIVADIALDRGLPLGTGT